MKKFNIILVISALAFVTWGAIGKKSENIGTNIGDKAPEIVLKNPDGKEVALSSLKGKVVLIDFWASWCRPCRMENPNVVSAYKKYKELKFKDAKGFEIYSVSLDNNLAAWKNGIAQDQLVWEYHVSDLLGWGSAGAKLYGVQGIPTNFLIDAKGIIVAKNLRGPVLDTELDKLLKK